MSTTAISEYALLSDRHSAALVARDGSVDWLCFPRFDSPSIFARLLGEPAGPLVDPGRDARRGDPSLRRSARWCWRRRTARRPAPPSWSTRWRWASDNRGHELGAGLAASPAPTDRRARRARSRSTSSSPPARSTDSCSRCSTWSTAGVAATRRGRRPGPVVRRRRWRSTARPPRPGSRSTEGERAAFALAPRAASRLETAPGSGARTRSRARLDDTVAAWQSWSEMHQAYVGPWHDLVHHSGRVLQALSFQPTGAICAAATTSLPEVVGGDRNWDYRYAWVRDASLHHRGAVGGGVSRRGQRVLRLHDRVGGRAPSIAAPTSRSCSASAANATSPSASCPTSPGGASPRRCASATARGASVSSTCTASCSAAVHRLWPITSSAGRAELAPSTRRFLVELGRHRRAPLARAGPGHLGGARRAAPLRVLQADVLGGARPGDRARRPARRRGPGRRRGARTRDEIRDAILEQGWNDRVGAFTQSFGSDDLDASNLMLATGRVPSRRRPEGAGDHRGHRGRGSPTSAGSCTATAAPTGSTARRAASSCAPSGSRRLWRWRGRPNAPAPCSSARPSSSTTSGLLAEEVDTDTGELLGQLPAGVQPHRPRQRGVGHLRGRGARRRLSVFNRSRRPTTRSPVGRPAHTAGRLRRR